MEKPFYYETDPNFDYVLDEKNNTFIAARKIKWGESADFKLDIRKYYATAEGEKMAKGCSLTDEAANELVRVLLAEGYGDDKTLYETIKQARPYIMSRFYTEMSGQFDTAEVDQHLSEYPVNDDEEEYFDLEEAI